jgi:hypothetical protein
MRRLATVLSLGLMLLPNSPLTVPVAAQQNQNPRTTALAIPVVGAVSGAITGTFNGTATITRFARVNDTVAAVGTITGTVTNAAGQVVQSLATNFAVPVSRPDAITAQQASCEILNLVLGPLHLDLLGLVIDLNQVVLNITAVAGAGNLLGNLLCAVTGLLDGGGSATQIVNLLNGILTAL